MQDRLAAARQAMVNADRSTLFGHVEIHETSIPDRTLDHPIAGGQGRSHNGKISVIWVTELLEGNKPCRIRREVILKYKGPTLKGFIERNVELGSHIWTDALASYAGLRGYRHYREHGGPRPCRGSTVCSRT